MKTIAYHLLDIVQNAIQAQASDIRIQINESDASGVFSLTISDDGRGMSEDQLRRATDPYYTSRDTRNVGLGLPLLKQNAERTGGFFRVDSEVNLGTKVLAVFNKNNIDCPSKGDVGGTIHQLITSNTSLEFWFSYTKNGVTYELDTRELKEVLDGMPLYQREVSAYIKEMIMENLEEINACDDFSYTT